MAYGNGKWYAVSYSIWFALGAISTPLTCLGSTATSNSRVPTKSIIITFLIEIMWISCVDMRALPFLAPKWMRSSCPEAWLLHAHLFLAFMCLHGMTPPPSRRCRQGAASRGAGIHLFAELFDMKPGGGWVSFSQRHSGACGLPSGGPPERRSDTQPQGLHTSPNDSRQSGGNSFGATDGAFVGLGFRGS